MSDWLNAYDKNADTKRTENFLPHWFQVRTATFLTFRLADSMPQSVMDRWKREQFDFLARRGIQGKTIEQGEALLEEPWKTIFKNYRLKRFRIYLQHGYGKCELKLREVSSIVADVILAQHKTQYYVDRFIVMPNHVHLIAAFDSTVDMIETCERWMNESALRIAQVHPINPIFWQPEPFDHCIRSGGELQTVRKYIEQNQVISRIPKRHCRYWEQPEDEHNAG